MDVQPESHCCSYRCSWHPHLGKYTASKKGQLISQAVKSASGLGVTAALGSPANRAAPGAARFTAFMYSVTATQGTWATLSQLSPDMDAM